MIESGTTINHYKILSPIGKGGMGEVYLAEDPKLNRKVAIKFLSEEFSKDSEKVNRFVQEAKAVSALNHPHILTIHEIGEFGGTRYIATEFIEGKTLREHIESDDLSLIESVKIAEQAADALAAAHKAHIIHRDIKPENIMIREDGYAKILDFGLAKPIPHAAGEEDATVSLVNTDPGMVMGSVKYMSPEQARGKDTDQRTDIWSLGVVLYEMMTGHNPFDTDNVSDSLVAVVSKEPEAISNYVSGTPALLQEIISKALQKDSGERYSRMLDFAADIKKLRFDLEHNSGENKTVRIPVESTENKTIIQGAGVDQTTADRGEQTNTNISGAQAVTSTIKQHKFAAAVAFAVAVLIFAGFGYGLYQLIRNPKETGPPRPVTNLKIRRLTGDGNTYGAVISPDGKFLAFGKNSGLWLKQIETNSEVELIPKGEFTGGGASLVFSPDGNFIYFNAKKAEDKTPTVYRVPTLGGNTVKFLADAWGVTFSPDGKQVAFRRGNSDTPKTSVHIANTDGSNEREVAGFNAAVRFFSSKAVWSPDGKSLAVVVSGEDLKPNPYIPAVISVADGTVTELGRKSFKGIVSLIWHPQGDKLYFSGTDNTEGLSQIWEIGYPSGESRLLTQSTNRFDILSVTADGNSLVTSENEFKNSLWVSPDTNPKNAKQIIPYENIRADLSWTPDGRIVFVSQRSGAPEIWIMDRSGENPKQLTNDRKPKGQPDVSPDGRYIVLKSEFNLTRINIDGGSPLQLTNGADDIGPEFSADGQWVIYTEYPADIGVISQVAADGRTSRNLTDFASQLPRYSPDGKFFACLMMDEKTKRWDRIGIVPAEGGAPVKVFEISGDVGPDGPVWTPDGKNVTYLDNGLWVMPIDGGSPKKLEMPENSSGGIRGRSYSRDGKQIAIIFGTRSSNAVMITDFR